MLSQFVPTALYSAAQVRQLDQLAIDAGTPGQQLMERAAQAALERLVVHWPQARRLHLLCGKGNNGGDGYLLAMLALRAGMEPVVFEVADHAGQMQGDAATARARAAEAGVAISLLDQASDESLYDCELLVDAMLGTGLGGPPRSEYAAAIARLNASGLPVLAIDVPSGLCSDSGERLGEQAVVAAATMTFIGVKAGLLTGAAADHVGVLWFDALGVDQNLFTDVTAFARRLDWPSLAARLPARAACAYKNHSGHLLVIGGDAGMGGAALLAAETALRAGAGLVSVLTRAEHVAPMLARRPELMVQTAERRDVVAAAIERASAVVVGPGLGTGPWSQQLLQALVELDKPLLLDADALNLVAERPALRPRQISVVTPHLGEARRLLGGTVPASRWDCAQALLAEGVQAAVLKGAGSIVATRGSLAVCPYGNSGMATAGMGDVLSGVIGSLLAQGYPPGEAAELGVCWHAISGDLLASRDGQLGMLAGDMPGALRDAAR